LLLSQQDELYRLSYIYLRNRADCEDAMQDLVLTLFARIRSLREPAAFDAWVRRILINLCYRKLRFSRRIFSLERITAPNTEDTGATLASSTHPRTLSWTNLWQRPNENLPGQSQEGRLDLLEAISRLPKPQRDVVILHYFSDLTIEEVAKIFECPSGTVKSRLHKALNLLRSQMGGEYLE